MKDKGKWVEPNMESLTPGQRLALVVREAMLRTHSPQARLYYAAAAKGGTISNAGARRLVAQLRELARGGKMPVEEFAEIQAAALRSDHELDMILAAPKAAAAKRAGVRRGAKAAAHRGERTFLEAMSAGALEADVLEAMSAGGPVARSTDGLLILDADALKALGAHDLTVLDPGDLAALSAGKLAALSAGAREALGADALKALRTEHDPFLTAAIAWTPAGLTSLKAGNLTDPWGTPDLLSAILMPNKYGGGNLMWGWQALGPRLETGYGTETFLVTGTPMWSAFKCLDTGGPYLLFNGSDESQLIFDIGADTSWLEPGANTFLIWCWVRADTLAATNRAILSKWEGSGKYAYILYWNVTAGAFRFSVSSNGLASTVVDSTLSESTGTWYFLAGFFNPSTLLRIYVGAADSDLVIDDNTTSIPASIDDNDGDFVMAAAGGGAFWDGGIGVNGAWRGLPAATVNDYVQLIFEKTRQFYQGA